MQLPHPTIIKIDKKPITHERSVKYLSMILDPTFSWIPHIIELAKKRSRTIGIFYKLCYLIASDILKMLYYALIHPFTLYGITAWGLTFPSYLDQILKLQKKYLRAVTFSDPMVHSNPMFLQYNIVKLDDLHKFQLLSLVYKWKYSLLPIQYSSYFSKASDVHHHQTRFSSNEKLYINQVNTTQYGLRTVHFSGAELWNSLSNELKQNHSFPSFKINLRNYLMDQ